MDSYSRIHVLTSQTFLEFVVLDAPEHENHTRHDREHESVGEMAIQRQFDNVAPKSEGAGGLNQRREHPPTYGARETFTLGDEENDVVLFVVHSAWILPINDGQRNAGQ